MAYSLPKTASLDWLIVYSGARAALFGAKGAPAGQEAIWKGLLKEARALRDKRDDVRIEAASARATVRLADAEFDPVVFELGGEALNASGRNAKKQPYEGLFGTIAPSRVINLGAAKALGFAGPLIAKVNAMKATHPKIAAFAARLSKAAKTLQAALEESDARAADVAALDVERLRFLLKVERQVALTEVAILTKYPGDEGRVRAYLAPDDEGDAPKKKKDESEPRPEA